MYIIYIFSMIPIIYDFRGLILRFIFLDNATNVMRVRIVFLLMMSPAELQQRMVTLATVRNLTTRQTGSRFS